MVRILIPKDKKIGTVRFSGGYAPKPDVDMEIRTVSPDAFVCSQELQSPQPKQSGKSKYGNRSCFHPQLQGDAYLMPADRIGLRKHDLCWPFRTRNEYAEIELIASNPWIFHYRWNPPFPAWNEVLVKWTALPGDRKGKAFSKRIPRRPGEFALSPDDPIVTSTEGWESIRRPYYDKWIETPTDLNESFFRDSVRNTCLTLSQRVPYINRQEIFGSLNDDNAAQCVYVDCNTPMLLKELIHLKEDTEALARLLQGKINTKTLADLYLSTKYGARLTIHDANVIMDKVTDHLTGLIPEYNVYRVHSRTSDTIKGSGIFSDWQLECVSTVWYRPRPQWTLDRSLSNLIKWDLVPSLQNVWDFIPYTFVVDWFLDVEGALKSLDNQALWALNEVLECTETTKFSTVVDASIIDKRLTGQLTFTVYDRVVKPTLTYRQFHFTPSLDGFKHVAELSALIRQRT